MRFKGLGQNEVVNKEQVMIQMKMQNCIDA